MQNNNGIKGRVCLLLGGAVIGAAGALLLAPQAGYKSRRQLRKLGCRALSTAEAFQQDLREQVKDLVDDVAKAGSHGLDKGKEWTHQVRDELIGALETGRRILETEKERIQQRLK